MKTTMVLVLALLTGFAQATERARILDTHGIHNFVDGGSGLVGTLVS
jgi:hypothetical protein